MDRYSQRRQTILDQPIPQTITIKVSLESPERSYTQLLEQVNIVDCVDNHGDLNLHKVLLVIRNNYNIPLQNEEVCFYVEKIGIFVNCGIDPICEDIFLEPEEYASQAYLHIKIKKTGFSMVHRLLSLEQVVQQADEEAEIDYVEPEVPAKPKTRRIKERRIGHIIEKVIEWRNYYTGESGVRGAKFSLEEAAHYVKISKKSLDDYLFQIRYGHQHHFNFNEHYNDKVGVLRDFVRQQKKKQAKVESKNRKRLIKQEQEYSQD